MELIHGDYRVDYRDALVGKADIADRLEALKEDGDLVIWTADNKTLHTKMYELLLEDGTVRLLMGSANMTRSAVRNQVNLMAEWETTEDSDLHEDWLRHYEDHKRLSSRFLDALTEAVEASDEEREDVVESWVQGRVTAALPELEASEKVIQEVREAVDPVKSKGEPPEAVEVTMTGFDESAQDHVAKTYGGKKLGDVVRVDPQRFAQTLTERLQVPPVHLKPERREIVFHGPDHVETLGSKPPADNPEMIGQALGNVERFLETVDRFGITDHPIHVKAHMMEAILYFFWAPFSDATAKLYNQHGVQSTKRLPFLYIWGESNAGKDTLCRFAYDLISPSSWEPLLVNGTRLNNGYVENLWYASTVYPAVLSDVKKERIGRTGSLRNYWEEKPKQLNVPSIVMTSNDSRPGPWFRQRAKVLTFDCVFDSGVEGDRYVQRLREEPNSLFEWFVHEYLGVEISPKDDPLHWTREIFQRFYEVSDREVPAFFPAEPAEEAFSLELLELQKKNEIGTFEIRRQGGDMFLEFDEDIQHWLVPRIEKRLPTVCRAEAQGRRIHIKNPEAFNEWWGDDGEDGFLDRLRGKLGL